MAFTQGVAGSVTGTFGIFTTPVTLPQYSVWNISTELEVTSMIMDNEIGKDCTDLDTDDNSLEEGAAVIDEVQVSIPPSIVDYAVASGLDGEYEPDKLTVLVGDGGHWPNEKRWGVGIISRVTGRCWSFGGQCDSLGAFVVGNNVVDAAVPEALAIKWMIDIGYQTGRQRRSARMRERGATMEDWDCMGRHLIVVSDRTALIGNLVKMGSGGHYRKVRAWHDPKKSAYQSVVERIAVSISKAITTYERVTILHKSQIPSDQIWCRKLWPPHKLASIGGYAKSTPVHMHQNAFGEQDFVMRHVRKEGALYLSATFSYEWEP